ncbi:MAG: tRNA preQ1(34) S-adenosylmethionine ribosyltransferase-isomerase QueA [Candidatus Omnitrophica bacterium]|nr:tRNA preQ1(34) S-adenosylmethionine ribosyltransferase-isomerase QueA [Candidatus Omnitrophota bacterium]
MLKLTDFDFDLPKELIAQYPLKERDAAKLIVVHKKSGQIEHRSFKDIIDYLSKDDLLVLNDTKVMPARLIGRRKTGGKAEVLIIKKKDEFTYDCLIKPSRIKLGEEVIFNGAKIIGKVTSKGEIRFSLPEDEVYAHGVMPLPPYIKREPEAQDAVYYQTEYAKVNGAIASPTAGLHFTRGLLKEIADKGTDIAYVTLHVGPGTFKPVKSENILEHKMDAEQFFVPDKTIGLINKAKEENSRIVAVGTTSLRVLETYASGKKEGSTDLFIYPGYKFRSAECLLTNFHLPKTTLFMLVCAFCAAGASASGGAGLKLARRAYQEAIGKKYRFYSYGDAMLIV